MIPVSKDLSKQIEREAKDFADRTFPIFGDSAFNWEKVFNAYVAGATAYAHYKERWEQAMKALEKVKWLCAGHHEVHNDNISKIWEESDKALASWKEEGKGGDHEG